MSHKRYTDIKDYIGEFTIKAELCDQYLNEFEPHYGALITSNDSIRYSLWDGNTKIFETIRSLPSVNQTVIDDHTLFCEHERNVVFEMLKFYRDGIKESRLFNQCIKEQTK